jgi:hypothetical protein
MATPRAQKATTGPKTEIPPAPAAEPEVIEQVSHEEAGISQWEFIHRAPTREQVVHLLQGLPDVYGAKYIDFADFVQALPQRKKIKKRDSRGREHEIYFDTWSLYMSVSGRIAMVQRIEDSNDWVIDFEPEPVTPTGIPGLLTDGKEEGRIVYREYMKVSSVQGQPLGRKPGMAWVPYSGGQQAAGSNPYEKVETSARGRAIAAWGIGVFPGSGIASVEEIEQAFANKRAIDAEGVPNAPQQQQQRGGRPSRAELIQGAKTTAEQYRTMAGMTVDEIEAKVGNYLRERLGIEEAYFKAGASGEDPVWVLSYDPVKDGQLQMLINDLQLGVRKLEADGPLG